MKPNKSTGPKESVEDGIFGLALFLITSARGLIDERHMYGPLRLIEAISRLAELYLKTNGLTPDAFMLKAKKEIDQNKTLVMSSEVEFIAFMDRMVIEFTEELKKRSSSRHSHA